MLRRRAGLGPPDKLLATVSRDGWSASGDAARLPGGGLTVHTDCRPCRVAGSKRWPGCPSDRIGDARSWLAELCGSSGAMPGDQIWSPLASIDVAGRGGMGLLRSNDACCRQPDDQDSEPCDSPATRLR